MATQMSAKDGKSTNKKKWGKNKKNKNKYWERKNNKIKEANTYTMEKSVWERKRLKQQLLFIFCFLLQNKTGSLIFEIGCYVQNIIKIDVNIFFQNFSLWNQILNYVDIKTVSKSFSLFNYILIKIQLTLIKFENRTGWDYFLKQKRF